MTYETWYEAALRCGHGRAGSDRQMASRPGFAASRGTRRRVPSRVPMRPPKPMPNLICRFPALAGLFAMTLSACGTTTIAVVDGPGSTVVLDETAAAAAITRYRAQHGLGPVSVDAGLVVAAAYQAGTNARAGVLSHEIGGGFTARMASAGLARAWAAENLSAGSETFDQVLARWKASPEHNRNMLIPQIRRIGIARVDAPGTRYKRFWALVMAGG